MVLGADQRADDRGADGAVHLGQLLDVVGRHAAGRCGAFGRPFVDVQGELVEAKCVISDPLLVGQAITYQDVHDRQHQRNVGAGKRLDEPVGGRCGLRADGIEHHHLGAVGTSLFDGRPEVAVRQLGVGAPQDDQLRVADFLRVKALGRAECHLHAGTDRRPADRPLDPRRAQPIPEPLGEAHRQQALIAGIAVRHDGLCAVASDDLVESPGNLGQRLVPRDLFEPAFSLGSDAPQRVQDTIVAVHPIEELVDLRAQLALAVGVSRVAAHLHRDGCRPAAIHRDVPAARVGTVVVTTSTDDLGRGSYGSAHGPTLDLCRRFSSSK